MEVITVVILSIRCVRGGGRCNQMMKRNEVSGIVFVTGMVVSGIIQNYIRLAISAITVVTILLTYLLNITHGNLYERIYNYTDDDNNMINNMINYCTVPDDGGWIL